MPDNLVLENQNLTLLYGMGEGFCICHSMIISQKISHKFQLYKLYQIKYLSLKFGWIYYFSKSKNIKYKFLHSPPIL